MRLLHQPTSTFPTHQHCPMCTALQSISPYLFCMVLLVTARVAGGCNSSVFGAEDSLQLPHSHFWWVLCVVSAGPPPMGMPPPMMPPRPGMPPPPGVSRAAAPVLAHSCDQQSWPHTVASCFLLVQCYRHHLADSVAAYESWVLTTLSAAVQMPPPMGMAPPGMMPPGVSAALNKTAVPSSMWSSRTGS